MTSGAGRAWLVARGVLLGLSVATCAGPGPASVSRQPSGSSGPAGVDWVTAADVERPEGMSATPPSISPVGNGGGLGHPGHFSGQGNPLDVATDGERWIAVGYTYPDFRGVTWTSTDRQRWALGEVRPGQADTFVLAIAASGGRWVAVGRHGGEAAAWSSTDGSVWQPGEAAGDGFLEPPETRMTTVIATSSGLIAGGWAGLITQDGRPRFWTSVDGTAWTRRADDPGLADGRVASIVAGPGGYVAIGTTGAVGRASGSAVWRSTDGIAWERVHAGDALAAGAMASVTTGGPGYVAVGTSLDATKALVWLSPDGATWTLAPDQEALTYHGLKIEMDDVVAGRDGTLVGVGHFLFGTQYGQGATWTSPDGRTWTRAPDLAVFGQGEPVSVIADGPGYLAVGTVGAPDNFIPTVWLSPQDR